MNAKRILTTAVTIALFGSAAWAAPGGDTGKPTGESAGNNLSFPVIWSDGVAKALRGDYGVEQFYGGGDCATNLEAPCMVDENEVTWFFQQEEDNEWQAENAMATAPVFVDEIDWGDNLEARAWNVNSIVRVETVLYKTPLVTPMIGYEMNYLFGDGPSEMQGTNTNTYESTEATVYSHCARLTIQKLKVPREEVELADVDWDPVLGEWVGEDVEAAVLNSGVWSGVEGPESPNVFSAEVNVGGKVIYGFNWRVRKLDPQPEGDWRLTFSLDDFNDPDDATHCDEALNTDFLHAEIRLPVEEEMFRFGNAYAVMDEPDLGGGTAYVLPEYNLTYIDVRIEAKKGGGGNNGRGQGSGGGKGSGGGSGGGGSGGGYGNKGGGG